MNDSGAWKVTLIVGGAVLAVLMVIGICISIGTSRSSQGPGIVTMQQKQIQMMDQAMQMAREAQQAQREHMRMMREAMSQEYGENVQYSQTADGEFQDR